MTLEELKKNLKETQNKSEAPTEYEKVLTDAFRFLGFQAKTIGGRGDTDVLLTANIGKESYKVDVDGKTSRNEKIRMHKSIGYLLKTIKKKINQILLLLRDLVLQVATLKKELWIMG